MRWGAVAPASPDHARRPAAAGAALTAPCSIDAPRAPRLPDGEPAGFARGIARTLRHVLGRDLTAVYVTGSVALGDHVPGASDLDMIAVSRAPLDDLRKRRLAGAVLPLAETCPARALGLVVYAAPDLVLLRRAWWHADGTPTGISFELELNAGPAVPVSVAYSAGGRSPHPYVLDMSIAREHALAVSAGPAPGCVLPAVPRPAERAAIDGVLTWYARKLPADPSAVLAACRAWRRVTTGLWSSKLRAAAWAESEAWEHWAIIGAAVDRYQAGRPMPSPAAVRDFLWDVRTRLLLTAA